MSFDFRQAVQLLDKQLIGQKSLIEFSLANLIAGGHLLLEGPPGVGKTKLAIGLASLFGAEFGRVQMTSDMLPSDIIGFLRPNKDTLEFEFRPGPLFRNFILIDELNRATPKTQSALLEAMAENQVTVDGKKHSLPQPFFVIATQNPVDSQGVFPLTESQLDRFSLLLEMELPSDQMEIQIYIEHLNHLRKVIPHDGGFDLKSLAQFRSDLSKITFEESVFKYFYQLILASRSHPEVNHGVSVRGSLQFLDAVRALAFVRERKYVHPKDLQDLAVPAMAHRLSLIREGATLAEKRIIVGEIIRQVAPPT